MRTQGRLLPGLGQDLRYGFRTLRKNPGFTAVAMLALALGIGANTAVFGVVNGALLRPLLYPDPGRLLMIYETRSSVGSRWRARTTSIGATRAASSSIWAPSAAMTSTGADPNILGKALPSMP